MNKKARNATLFGIAAGIVLVPLIRAVISKYKTGDAPAARKAEAPPNHLFSAYLGRFKPHRRKAAQNGLH